jgi:hypothetical protein
MTCFIEEKLAKVFCSRPLCIKQLQRSHIVSFTKKKTEFMGVNKMYQRETV